jgi:OOP family OmpA-OmpF porin
MPKALELRSNYRSAGAAGLQFGAGRNEMSLTKGSWLIVLPLLVIWLVANVLMTERVETDLAARAGVAVGSILDNPSVMVEGRDAILAGTAFSPQGSDDARDAALGTPGVRLVDAVIAMVPVAKPYRFGAKRDGDRLVLSGNVPYPAARAKLLQAAKASALGVTVVDEMTYAQGAPDAFETIASYGLAEAGKLANAEISLFDNAYSIAGRAPTAAVYRAALAAVRQLPAGAIVAKINISSEEISPYILNATKSEGVIKLTGRYPDEQAHQKLLDAVQRSFFNSKVSDELALGKGAPKDFLGAASAMLLQLSRLESGVGTVSDMDVNVKGDALYAKAASDIPGELTAAIPPDYKALATIGVAAPSAPVSAADCQPLFADILGQGKILFETGQASIQHDSDAVLDNLTAIAMRCADAQIEISGHTDSVGGDETNMELSRLRAEAVAEYLKNAGIAAERMTAVGYGKMRPIASNDTEEGRAQNRRIEFEVK